MVIALVIVNVTAAGCIISPSAAAQQKHTRAPVPVTDVTFLPNRSNAEPSTVGDGISSAPTHFLLPRGHDWPEPLRCVESANEYTFWA